MSNASSAKGPRTAASSKLGMPRVAKAPDQSEPPLLRNKVTTQPSKPLRSPKTSAQASPRSTAKNPASTPIKARAVTKAPKRRASDNAPQNATIDNVRELLLGDTLQQSNQKLEQVERKTIDQVGLLREELTERIDRVVRALATVNQAVHKEVGAREEAEEAITTSAAELDAKTQALATRMEDRLSFLEAKIYTVVADVERKVTATQAADKDKLIEQLTAANAKTEARLTDLAKAVEQQLTAFGQRITHEIGEVSDAVTAAQTKAGEEAEELGTQVGKRLGAVEAQLGADLNELRTQISSSSARLQTELAEHAQTQQEALTRSQEATALQLRDHIQTLEGQKVSRSDFSVLLQELALKLDDDAP